jgi:hypothetical protein
MTFGSAFTRPPSLAGVSRAFTQPMVRHVHDGPKQTEKNLSKMERMANLPNIAREVAKVATDLWKNEGAGTEPLRMCSKEGCPNPRADADNSNPWCKEHRAEYQREYERTRLAKKERHGYAEGIRAMRELLASEFDQLGYSQFTAMECAILIRNAPGPKLPD